MADGLLYSEMRQAKRKRKPKLYKSNHYFNNLDVTSFKWYTIKSGCRGVTLISGFMCECVQNVHFLKLILNSCWFVSGV